MNNSIAKDLLEKENTALKSELEASLAREAELESNYTLKNFMKKKISRTKLYRAAKNPDSKFGRILRAPRTIYRIAKNPEIIQDIRKKKLIIENSPEEKKFPIPPHKLDPWMLSFDERLEILKKAKKDNKKIALYLVEKPDSSTFRYRCYNTMQITKSSKTWQAVYFYNPELEKIKNHFAHIDTLVIGRESCSRKLIDSIIKLAKKYSLNVSLDIDDLVFDKSRLDSFLEAIGEGVNRSYWAGYIDGVEYLAKNVDSFIVTNDFLRKIVENQFNKPCFVIPNFLNEEQLDASVAYLFRKNIPREEFLIGYFSGSPTHSKDFALIETDIVKFLKAHKNAKLLVVGYMKFSKSLDVFLDNGQIQFIPPVDFRKLQRLMSEVNVNLAPLVENEFTNCKSELKFFESAIVETTTIASPTYAFKTSIKDGKTGFLCNPGEWFDRLEFLYKNPEENRKIAKAARKFCLEEYSGEKIIEKIEKVYDKLKK